MSEPLLNHSLSGDGSGMPRYSGLNLLNLGERPRRKGECDDDNDNNHFYSHG